MALSTLYAMQIIPSQSLCDVIIGPDHKVSLEPCIHTGPVGVVAHTGTYKTVKKIAKLFFKL